LAPLFLPITELDASLTIPGLHMVLKNIERFAEIVDSSFEDQALSIWSIVLAGIFCTMESLYDSFVIEVCDFFFIFPRVSCSSRN